MTLDGSGCKILFYPAVIPISVIRFHHDRENLIYILDPVIYTIEKNVRFTSRFSNLKPSSIQVYQLYTCTCHDFGYEIEIYT